MPLDLVILMLGTNDLKYRFAATPGDIADSIEILVRAVQRSEAGPAGAAPATILVAPPPIQEIERLAEMFLGGAAKSLRLGDMLHDVARRCEVAFIDAGAIVESSTVDGIHLDSDVHRNLGCEVAKVIQGIFPA